MSANDAAEPADRTRPAPREPAPAGQRAERRQRRPGDHRPPHRQRGVDRLDHVRQQVVRDPLPAVVEDEPGRRRVVVSHQHQRVVGRGIARLGDDVPRLPSLRQRPAREAAPVRAVVGDRDGRSGPGDRGERRAPCPQSAARPGQRPDGGERRVQPRVAVVELLLVDAGRAAGALEALAQPVRGDLLAGRPRAALERREVLDQLAPGSIDPHGAPHAGAVAGGVAGLDRHVPPPFRELQGKRVASRAVSVRLDADVAAPAVRLAHARDGLEEPRLLAQPEADPLAREADAGDARRRVVDRPCVRRDQLGQPRARPPRRRGSPGATGRP